jgi:hypothetical protein
MEKGVLRSENVFWSNENPPNLGAVTILGIGDPVAEVLVNNVAQAFRYDTIHKVKNRVVHACFFKYGVEEPADCERTIGLQL